MFKVVYGNDVNDGDGIFFDTEKRAKAFCDRHEGFKYVFVGGVISDSVYTTNVCGIPFTKEEADAFNNGEGYHGHHGCRFCPHNRGHKQGASHIAGPCGQQVCFVTINLERE